MKCSDYYDIIQTPMDFTTIKVNIFEKSICYRISFIIMFIIIVKNLLKIFLCNIIFYFILYIILRVFSNCILYNGYNSEIG